MCLRATPAIVPLVGYEEREYKSNISLLGREILAKKLIPALHDGPRKRGAKNELEERENMVG